MVIDKKEKITILYPYFKPGYKAGGITQSLYNLCIVLSKQYTLQVICLNHDLNETEPYSFTRGASHIETKEAYALIVYLSSSSYRTALRYIKAFNPDYIYVNSLYNVGFILIGLLGTMFNKRKLIIAPRGMLHEGGLQKGKNKKLVYINTLRVRLSLQKNLTWHATDEQEVIDIKKRFGTSSKICLAADTPRPYPEQIVQPIKQTNELKLVYYSLITSKKNLGLLIESLQLVSFPVSLDIYGPIIEKNYWAGCEQLIRELNRNVTVVYKGEMVFETFALKAHEYHFLVLPSKGENFGHVIYESLTLGLPVLISRNTPWTFKEGSVGYYVDLTTQHIASVVEQLYKLEKDAYARLSDSALQYARSYYIETAKAYTMQYGVIFSKDDNLIMPQPVKEKPVILILFDYFFPGYRAGGPVQSLMNLVTCLHENYTFKVIANPYDLNETEHYQGIRLNEWNKVDIDNNVEVSVWYTDLTKATLKDIRSIITDAAPDYIYINGIYSLPLFVYTLLLKSDFKKKFQSKIILSPRGMLQKGALTVKPAKKVAYLAVVKALGLTRNITWHLVDHDELIESRNTFTIRHFVEVNNIPKRPYQSITYPDKQPGTLKLVYLSLITEKKNLLLLLETLAMCQSAISLDVYGPVKDKPYWAECKKKMEALPAHISVNYKGDVLPNNVQYVLSQYHAMIMLTKGENFGHALYESFSVGRPVITSYFTPWNKLEEKQAGWNVDITKPADISALLDNLSACTTEAWAVNCKGAQQLAIDYYDGQDFKTLYKELFS